jgi:hypothetical protein
VRIGRMNLWLDIGGVIKQDIEHVVAFVLICADDVRIDGDMVGDERIGDNSLFQPEVFWRMTGIERVNPGSNFWPSLLECRASPIS